MRRRTAGSLLATGIVAFAAVHGLADFAGAQDSGLRSFASQGLGAAIGSAPAQVQQAPAAPQVEIQQAQVQPRPSLASPPPASPVQAQPQPQPQVPAQSPAQAKTQANAPATSLPAAPSAGWPKTLPEAKAEAAAKANPQAAVQSWPQAEIDLARARCTAVLKGLDAVTIPEPSIREGECGTPAPVRLVSIGRNPEVALSPPPVVTCDMVVAMHSWMKSDLQPLARKHLGAPIIKIETMSDYSCRNAYGRAKTRLSEHGRANAIDIRGFTTAKGDTAILLADWGMTARDIAAQVAAAKLEAQKQAERVARAKAAAEAALLAAKAQKSQPGAQPATGTASAAAAGGPAIGLRDGGETLVEGLPKVRITIPGTARDDDGDKSSAVFGVEPSRLGGPKPTPSAMAPPLAMLPVKSQPSKSEPAKTGAAPPPAAAQGTKGSAKIVHAPASSHDQVSGKAKFLREAHAAGCRIFGTTLGPEANNAHRNHLHVDMAERATTNFCE